MWVPSLTGFDSFHCMCVCVYACTHVHKFSGRVASITSIDSLEYETSPVHVVYWAALCEMFSYSKTNRGYCTVCELSGNYGYCSNVTYTLGEGGA